MSNEDVLVALRAWRDEFARSHGYDLHAMAATLRELDCTAGQKVVRGEPRRPEAAKPAETRMPNLTLHPTGATSSVSPSAEPLKAASAAEL
jgi:hypothetical protein